ncbi:hypothetical protein [Denitrobaculum tricleocarpae]|uniref:Lipoprotein n=1 Tax=Denitrobaculum tricleocarpae TaxID=2591009 RepID=A0A545T1X0_9PROT|nr:hypothetical protein [Denitrobaculum tricleocarpae]TQV71224.1 hypothetical protein FKG95_26685 [Denitrobaculum tricleocarpae]
MARTTPIHQIVPALLVLAVGLTACSSFQEQEYQRQPAASSTLVTPPAPTEPGKPVEVPPTTGTYPYGTASETPAEGAADQDEAFVRGPDGSLWKGAAQHAEAHNADIESCYRYAAAQTENDARIEQDRRAVYGDGFSDTQSVGLLSSKLRSYDHESRRRSLFSSCMRSKGYAAR